MNFFVALDSAKKYSIAAALIGVVAGVYALCWYYFTLKIWNGVPPIFIEDADFYFARIKEIVDGNIFFGNPYYLEHRGGVAPSFTIADWFAAIPLWLTHSWTVTLIANTIVWNGLYTWVTYKFFDTWNVDRRVSLLATVAALSQTYLHLQRPVHIQVSAVFFPLVLWVFSHWLLRVKRDAPWCDALTVVLGVVVAVGMYAYTFVGQIGLSLIGLTFVVALVRRHVGMAKQAFAALGIAIVLLLPLIVFLYGVTTNTYYAATMGMIYSRAPVPIAVTFARVIVVGLLWVLALLWVLHERLSDLQKNFLWLTAGSFIAMLIVSFSNVLTGKYLEFGQHVKQFSFPLAAAVLAIGGAWCVHWRRELWRKKMSLAVLSLLATVLLVFVARNAYLRNQLRFFNPDEARHAQTYAPPLAFLDRYAAEPSVVLSPFDLSRFVSVLSRHSVAYTPAAYIFAPPPHEQEARSRLSGLYVGALKNNGVLVPNEKNEFGALLNRFNVRFVMLEKQVTLTPSVFTKNFGWTVRYEDELYVIFERQTE
ncbi:MAG: hypothetical protein A2848_02700 [Candidatus Magasanikbacteria bacterium RIFCSPHIGHO2_01_FULL_50_8]|uniref:Glycosyltransferase RgtA/B/C/D-like domain-containing protein n=2 Tax=Candidatus Magasanikiibacteriota TaxID=1752731 RepID=A0A1F6LUK8_9BACT|nr:MAG: hypothetical protein A2848_02700 [Candidatus Magasanikbacteria bacterium RIFCSPHIGHO2_01_FULL_50_8]OGH68214.1 MAG: hypothetical protein A3C15_03135 [Candidatus Magasanikbacteria bacterium RIFCSPHIGHO2_02_FULL_50_9b]